MPASTVPTELFYTTASLIEAFKVVPLAPQFLRDKLFPRVSETASDLVAVDFYNGSQRLAPYASRFSRGTAVPREKTQTSLFSPPHGGRYVKAGDHLPVDFVLPPHLDRFVVNDDSPPPQISRATSRFSTERHQGDFGAGSQLAKPAMATYPEGEEKFAPRWAKKIRRAPREERKGKL